MKLEKSRPTAVSDILLQYLRSIHLGASHNTQRIFEAWDKASSAADFTLKKFFRDGTLYITLSSSVARTHLEMQREELIIQINAILAEDDLFIRDDKTVGFVSKLVLK